VLEALSEGELGGVAEKERRWSTCGLRLNRCRVRAKILRGNLSAYRGDKGSVKREIPGRTDAEVLTGESEDEHPKMF